MSSIAPADSSEIVDLASITQNANDGVIDGTSGVLTAFELDPWWQVDLEAVFAVERAFIYDGLTSAARRRLSVLGSMDGQVWTLQGAKLDGERFGGPESEPFVFEFARPFHARFVRIALIGEGALHLDEVELYGKQVLT